MVLLVPWDLDQDLMVQAQEGQDRDLVDLDPQATVMAVADPLESLATDPAIKIWK